jgi:hypothetical protein
VKNPFTDFCAVSYQKKDIPLERILRAKVNVMDRILDGYNRLVEEEAKDLVWVVEKNRLAKTYHSAVKSIMKLEIEQEDIEEFCAELEHSNKFAYAISGPAGVYISAMVNYCQSERIILNLMDYKKAFHFLGYKLPEGKTLLLQDRMGDYIGAALDGGCLTVEGSTGNWCGAGMVKGEILVTDSTGDRTGEWMQGGEIHVSGQVKSKGMHLYGGKIIVQGKMIFP